MQKKILTYIGIILILIAITRTAKYLQNSTLQFSNYEQGFILGNSLLLLCGMLFIFFGIKKTTKK